MVSELEYFAIAGQKKIPKKLKDISFLVKFIF